MISSIRYLHFLSKSVISRWNLMNVWGNVRILHHHLSLFRFLIPTLIFANSLGLASNFLIIKTDFLVLIFLDDFLASLKGLPWNTGTEMKQLLTRLGRWIIENIIGWESVRYWIRIMSFFHLEGADVRLEFGERLGKITSNVPIISFLTIFDEDFLTWFLILFFIV